MLQQRFEIPAFHITDCQIREHLAPTQLIVLLHGYGETGAKIFKKCEPFLPKNAFVIAPNAPYPQVERTPNDIKVGFSWYFYDPRTDEYFIGPEISSLVLQGLVERLNFASLPVTLIGFSQGGYLAPLAAKRIKNVRRVIGIGSTVLHHEFEFPISFELDLIHGDQDEIVHPEAAQQAHSDFLKKGGKGSFHLISGVGHRITPEIQSRLGELLEVSGP